MTAATVVQQLCRTCFKFYCMFYFTCDRSLIRARLVVNKIEYSYSAAVSRHALGLYTYTVVQPLTTHAATARTSIGFVYYQHPREISSQRVNAEHSSSLLIRPTTKRYHIIFYRRMSLKEFIMLSHIMLRCVTVAGFAVLDYIRSRDTWDSYLSNAIKIHPTGSLSNCWSIATLIAFVVAL